jgi:histidinol-phosphate aminotransferase
MSNILSGWESNVRQVIPYVPGEQPKVTDIIKLNTNENPYPPSPKVVEAYMNFNCDTMKLYPAPNADILVNSLAERYKVKPSQVFVGVGSDDVISMAFLTFFNSDKPILFPDITYSFYDVWADVYKVPYKTMPLDDDFRIVKEDYMQENGGIIFPNPNAPTGVLESVEMIEEIIKANPDSVIIIDEAYIDFGGKSCLSLIDKYENLLVVQTFSKSRSMAGARLGFAVANSELILDLNRIKYSTNPYNVNRMTAGAGLGAIKDKEYFVSNCKTIIENRAFTTSELEKLGFTVTDSMTNFVFAKSDKIGGEELYLRLKEKGVLVRHFGLDRIKDYVRVTIGSLEQMTKFIDCVKQILEEN